MPVSYQLGATLVTLLWRSRVTSCRLPIHSTPAGARFGSGSGRRKTQITVGTLCARVEASRIPSQSCLGNLRQGTKRSFPNARYAVVEPQASVGPGTYFIIARGQAFRGLIDQLRRPSPLSLARRRDPSGVQLLWDSPRPKGNHPGYLSLPSFRSLPPSGERVATVEV